MCTWGCACGKHCMCRGRERCDLGRMEGALARMDEPTPRRVVLARHLRRHAYLSVLALDRLPGHEQRRQRRAATRVRKL